MLPETKYTRSGPVNVAYQVFGNGSHDILLVPGWISNIDVFWEEPTVARFFEELAKFSRVMLFDKRGTGLSDRVTGIPTLEERMDDVRAVMNAADSKNATLFGYSEGGPMCALFAATYPERTRSLVLMGSYARRQSAPDYEFGLTNENSEQLLKNIESNWGTPLDIERRIPSMSSNERFRRWWAKFMRAGASPASAVALMKMNFEIDVRPILPSIRVPALILHARGDRIVDIEAGRYLAKQIPNARLIELDAVDHVPFGDSMSQVIDEIEQFVTGRSTVHVEDRVVSTIMFTDIVDSTRAAAEMGDAAWRDSLEAHHAAVRAELDRFRGTEIKTTGDGFHATFDGPARAIRCGQAICHSVAALGLRVRVGIHTGECVRTGHELEGIAVHIAARIGALAEAGQVLVSQTVRDLVAGSGISFQRNVVHQLKGVDGEWSVCAVNHASLSG